MNYETAGQRCPKCRGYFEVLADEAGTHECPYCGLRPEVITDNIRCNNCYRVFKDEDELEFLENEDGEFKGCPVCETDDYLMDLD